MQNDKTDFLSEPSPVVSATTWYRGYLNLQSDVWTIYRVDNCGNEIFATQSRELNEEEIEAAEDAEDLAIAIERLAQTTSEGWVWQTEVRDHFEALKSHA